MVDAILFRFQPYQIGEEKLLCHGFWKNIFTALEKKNIIPPLQPDTFDMAAFSEEELERRIQYYVDQLLSIYQEEQIILVEAENAYLKYDKNQNITAFSAQWQASYKEHDFRIKKMFSMLRERLKGAHLIPFPKHVLAYANHWMGLSGLHYIKGYYDYAFQAVEIINQHLPRSEEEAQIQQLCDSYSTRYAAEYATSLEEAVLRLNKKYWAKQQEYTILLQYVDTLTAYLQNGKDAVAFFKEKDIHQIGVYGYNRIANYFIPTLEKAGIHVRFVVENLAKQKQNELFPTQPQPFSILARNAAAYPKVDAVLITDLFNYDKLQKKIPTITKAPIYTIHDFL